MANKYTVLRQIKTEAGWHEAGSLILAEEEDVEELLERKLIELFVKKISEDENEKLDEQGGDDDNDHQTFLLTDIAEVTEEIGNGLIAIGITTVESLAESTEETLTGIRGVGPATAKKLIEKAQLFLSGGE